VHNNDDLSRQLKNVDETALNRLYEENFERIYRYILLKVGNQMEAEDLTQQVFLNAIRSFSTFEDRGMPVSAWLFRIAHNLVVDLLRKKSKRESVSLEDPRVKSVSGEDALDMVERNFNINELRQAVDQLTDAQKEVIHLRFAAELSIGEVARLMGRSEGAVKALQHSAIKALRKILVRPVDNE